jgi:hypothetical protein
MPRRPILLTSLILAAVAWAQEPPAVPPASAAEIAAKAMAAMDAMSESPATPDEGLAEADDASESAEKSEKAGKPGAALPPLLPEAKAEGARGIDVLSRARLDLMVPTGRSHRGVHYPVYRPVETDRPETNPVPGGIAGVTAPMASLFESERVTRLDDDHVQFDRAKFVQYAEAPAADGRNTPSMTLEIERGIYDLKNEILMTNQPVRIETPQFVIEGDTMVHDRASQLTRFTRAKMTFYADEPETTPVPSGLPANSPAPAPAPPVAPAPPTR